MLKGLNQIEWNSLEHANGPASDVPDAIRVLTSPDTSLRQRALEQLKETLWRQGVVTQAAAFAVPFLVEVLDQPDVEDKASIVLLLARMADDRAVPGPPAEFAVERVAWSAGDIQARLEQRWASAAAAAVERGMPTYMRLLFHTDMGIRIAIPYLLSTLPGHAQQSVPALGACLEDSEDPCVRASVLFALAALATPNPQALGLLTELIDDTNPPLVRIAAAGTLVLLVREDTPPNATAVLAEAIARPDPQFVAQYEQLPWCKSGFTGDLAATLAWLGPVTGGFAVPLLCRALGTDALGNPGDSPGSASGASGASGAAPANVAVAAGPAMSAAVICMRTLLHLAFDGGTRTMPLILARLNENQRMTLTAIAQSDTVWRWPAIPAEMLGTRALPNTRAALRQSLQLPV